MHYRLMALLMIGTPLIGWTACPLNAVDGYAGCTCKDGYTAVPSRYQDISSSEQSFECKLIPEVGDTITVNIDNSIRMEDNSTTSNNYSAVTVNVVSRDSVYYLPLKGSYLYGGLGVGKLSTGYASGTVLDINLGASWVPGAGILGIDFHRYGTEKFYSSLLIDMGFMASNGIGYTVGLGVALRESINKAYFAMNFKVSWDISFHWLAYALVQGNVYGVQCPNEDDCMGDLSETRDMGWAPDIRIGVNYKI